MNYKAHLESVFATPELAEQFMQGIMRQLNAITFNGANKIDKILGAGPGSTTLAVQTPNFKHCDKCAYYVSVSKASMAIPDVSEF